MQINIDDAVDPSFVEMLVKEYASYLNLAKTRQPKAQESADKVAKAESELEDLRAQVTKAEGELEVLRGEADASNADLAWATNRTRTFGSLIQGICTAKQWGMPQIPTDPPLKHTSDFPAVPVPPQATAVFPPVEARPQAARTPEWANGPVADEKLDGFLNGDAELDEADDPGKDGDEDPPAGNATADADAKPRLVQQMKNRATQAMSALFSWPIGRGRHIAVRTT